MPARRLSFPSTASASVSEESRRIERERTARDEARRAAIRYRIEQIDRALGLIPGLPGQQTLATGVKREDLFRQKRRLELELHPASHSQSYLGEFGNAARSMRGTGAVTIDFRPEKPSPTAPFLTVRITYAAYRLVEKFFAEHPAILSREQSETGVLPLQDPDGYFSRELTEPQHHDVRVMVELHDGVMGRGAVSRWAEEELHEGERPERLRPYTRHETSICPACRRQFLRTGKQLSPYCSACERVWRAPRGYYYPGSPLYPPPEGGGP